MIPIQRLFASEPVSFNERIQPILSEYCYHCHGPDAGSRQADLRLDRAEYAFAKSKDGKFAIVPGKPDESLLIQRILTTNVSERMPPPEAHKTLSAEDIALLRRWVAEGANYQEHWAFLTPQRPAIPAMTGSSTLHPIDSFIRARLAAEQLEPSAEADRRSLLRRVTFDLIGLPPTPAETQAFVGDLAPGAYERVVDRLLASPRFGEHRARYWLDAVRYGDTHGLHLDNFRSIWPYRDYVVASFNSNKPFDRFVREQLAGDLLPARTVDEFVATGWVRSNLSMHEVGTVPEDAALNRARDRTEAFGSTFLGLTVGCAACHDHKFDPVSQRDFYSLTAFFNNTVEPPWDFNQASPDPVIRIPTPENAAAVEVLLNRRADLQTRFDERVGEARSLMAAWLAGGGRPKTVPTNRLELRLKLDEGSGNKVKNSAPGAAPDILTTDTNPPVWGEDSWLWPDLRMDIQTRLSLGSIGNVEADEAFATGGWIQLRAIPPKFNPNEGTGSGTLLSRMGDRNQLNGRGWELRREDQKFVVSLIHDMGTGGSDLEHAGARGISVATRQIYPVGEWTHVFFTYDGSRTARGIRIYINGEFSPIDVRLDVLGPKDSIKTEATTHLGRRDDFDPMRETRFQDVRFYRRSLSPGEVARLPYEDIAAEIVARQPDPSKWTTDEAFVAADRFFIRTVDATGKELAAALAAHESALAALMKDGSPSLIAREKSTPAYAHTLKRGDYFARDERVGPATPHFMPPLPTGSPQNRRGLADWLFTPEQPLFARVTVNRMWQEVFGRGLVESSGDFGIMGSRPSHPELLDWLSVEFRESGWDVKRFYRTLVTSATYRQSARVSDATLAKDPFNKLLARGPRFRMDGEVLRDAALATSGLLVEKLGGPPVKPYQPPGIWEEVAMPGSTTGIYTQDKGEGLYRRTLYSVWKRSSPPPSMETFDAVSREVVCTQRARTNTPLQALVTMNDTQWVEAARKLAERTVGAVSTSEARLDFLANSTLGRGLDAFERGKLLASYATFTTRFRAEPEMAKALLTVGESPVDSRVDAVELAAWSMVASQFYNLDEFLSK